MVTSSFVQGWFEKGQDYVYPSLTHPSQIDETGLENELGTVGVILIAESTLIFLSSSEKKGVT